MSLPTPLQQARLKFLPKLPKILSDLKHLKTTPEKKSLENGALRTLFPRTLGQPKLKFSKTEIGNHEPLKVGVVLSGGQAAGGHNVITGIYDALTKLNSKSTLMGFLNGPGGIVDNKHIPLTKEVLSHYRNQGGFDLIGAGRTKIETPDQFQCAASTVKTLQLDGLVIIGGDDSNTNAALLAEYFLNNHIRTRVVGVPKTIDGDLKNEEVEISFGFDTATKTFSETIGSLLRDSLSAKKYYFFIKLMGRSASHIALECALQTHPNLTLIGEEVARESKTLRDLTNQISEMICLRSEMGKDFGVILIPEGMIEFIPEFNQLITELNRMTQNTSLDQESIRSQLSQESQQCFDSIPAEIQSQLLLERDPHGNVQVSKIETERLFIQSVEEELKRRKEAGYYSGKFSAQPLFCGYEGRSCFPSNFDCNYCYTLGHVAVLLINSGVTGYMSCAQKLAHPVEEWEIAGIPLTSMIHMEERKGKIKPVIQKALVDLKGNPFTIFKQHRDFWALHDDYRYPGPIQFFGPSEIVEGITLTLEYETHDNR